LSVVHSHAFWGINYNGGCAVDSQNASITRCNANGYTEDMKVTIDSENGVNFYVEYNQIGYLSHLYTEVVKTSDASHPQITATLEFRDDYGVVFGRIYLQGLHSEYHEDNNKDWINSVLYVVTNGTGVFGTYHGYVTEATLGDSSGHYEGLISATIFD